MALERGNETGAFSRFSRLSRRRNFARDRECARWPFNERELGDVGKREISNFSPESNEELETRVGLGILNLDSCSRPIYRAIRFDPPH